MKKSNKKYELYWHNNSYGFIYKTELEAIDNVIDGEAKDPDAKECPACGYEFK